MPHLKILNWTTLLLIIVLLLFVTHVGSQQQSEKQQPVKAPQTLSGEQLYRQYCASCHGRAAKGDGPVAKFLTVKVPDLTLIARNNGGTFPIGRIRNSISGENRPVPHGTSQMPVWGPYFSDVEDDRDYGKVRVDNVARYLESLQR
jgi:mono/diheme cytochrome c family protein